VFGLLAILPRTSSPGESPRPVAVADVATGSASAEMTPRSDQPPDEIGDLAEALRRMQVSLQTAMSVCGPSGPRSRAAAHTQRRARSLVLAERRTG